MHNQIIQTKGQVLKTPALSPRINPGFDGGFPGIRHWRRVLLAKVGQEGQGRSWQPTCNYGKK
jgi:hypothetical protein